MDAKVPYLYPGRGWMFEGRSITENEAERIGTELGVPFCEQKEGWENAAFLMVCDLAGASHVEGIENILKDLSSGDLLQLEREPSNRYDAAAILVKDTEGRKLGYIPKALNRVPSNLMDSGRSLYAIIHTLDGLHLSMLVYMELPGHAIYRHFAAFHDIGVSGIRIDAVPTGRWTEVRDFGSEPGHIIYSRSFG